MKEITFSKRNTFLILLTILLTGAGIFMIGRFAPQTATLEPTRSPDQVVAEQAAVEGTQAFFQIQSEAGKDAWLEHFCSLSTESGCAFIQMGADRLWKKYVEANTSIQAAVKAVEQVSATATEQVWKVDVSLSEPLPGSNKTQEETYVLAVKTDAGWKFDRFLLEPEIQALIERQQKENKP
ncbi:hypothetical protein [Anaerolinea sp.]|uniref:hypothetical protein n=1 Tax=Anaerolinea sp. TaxID=1872519 RepID=UPI002ACE918B|nr:hypothetical protein [Anaerolinea sp.]